MVFGKWISYDFVPDQLHGQYLWMFSGDKVTLSRRKNSVGCVFQIPDIYRDNFNSIGNNVAAESWQFYGNSFTHKFSKIYDKHSGKFYIKKNTDTDFIDRYSLDEDDLLCKRITKKDIPEYNEKDIYTPPTIEDITHGRCSILKSMISLRVNILLHSLMYYEFDKPAISDDAFDNMCSDLLVLNDNFRLYKDMGLYSKDFKDFDASTGFHLPYKDLEILNLARRLYSV